MSQVFVAFADSTVCSLTGRVVLKRLTRGDADFGAAVASLGVIGFITNVRFRVVADTYFEAEQLIVKLDDYLLNTAGTSAKYEFWRIDWIPKTKVGLMWRAKQIPVGHHNKDGDYPVDGAETMLKSIFKTEAATEKLDHDPRTPFMSHYDSFVYGLIIGVYGVDRQYGPLQHDSSGSQSTFTCCHGRVELQT